MAQNIVRTHFVNSQTDWAIDFRLYHRSFEKEEKEYLMQTAKPDYSNSTKEELVKRLIELLYFQRNRKSFKSKIELALELVDDSEQRKIDCDLYLFDNWYLAPLLTNRIESYNKDWISELGSNRILFVNNRWYNILEFVKTIPSSAYREIEIKQRNGEYKKYWTFTKVVQLKKLGKKRIVISYNNKELKGEPKLLVANRKDWEAKKIVQAFSWRWTIEPCHRDAKQHLGLEDCQLRSPKGIKRHWYLVFLAHTLLSQCVKQSILVKRAKSQLNTIGERCRQASHELLRSLVYWVQKELTVNSSPEVVFQLLVA